MISIKEKISSELLKIVQELGSTLDSVIVQEPIDSAHGDLSSNIAMQIAKDIQSNPREIAQKIVEKYPQDENIESIEIAGQGFLNFKLSDKYLLDTVRDISSKGDQYFKLDVHSTKRYVIEYTDPNPFKIFHIGHLYTNMVGESFARLQEALGATVYRAIYQGDVGLHVAKTMYGLKILLEKDGISFDDLKGRELTEKVEYLGEAYMLGFNQYDDAGDEKAIQEVRDINYYIFSLYIPSLEKKDLFNTFEDMGLKEWYTEGKEWCMQYFEKIYERTGTKFEKYYLEGDMSDKGLQIVLENTKPEGKGVFVKDSGSVIYKGDESKGLHTRVFINKDGLPTYEAKELALAFKKFEDIKFDESVIITADEQTAYFKVVLDALQQLSPEIANGTKHFPHGMIKLPGAEKMSSRKGKIISGEWLLNETRKRVSNLMRDSAKWSEDEINSVSDKISMAAIKYAFLKVSVGKDIIFDFEKSISFEGDTGPYLLYVYTRCLSILEDQEVDLKGKDVSIDAYTKELIRTLVRYQVVLLDSSLKYSPNILCEYLFDLGQSFNSFYQNVRVLDSENKEFLLLVVDAVSKTMKHGLNTLGINVVEKM
jgi:arginyl-tRNA synthetase